MTIQSAEHYEIIKFFDSQFAHLRLDKETKDMWAKGHIYQNGEANNLFLAFRHGVAYGKSVEFQGAAQAAPHPTREGPQRC